MPKPSAKSFKVIQKYKDYDCINQIKYKNRINNYIICIIYIYIYVLYKYNKYMFNKIDSTTINNLKL